MPRRKESASGAERDRYELLLREQARLLRQAMLAADILRWRLIDAGLPADKPPDIERPVEGRPVLLPWTKASRSRSELTQEGQEMNNDLPPVVATAEMTEDDFRKHLALRHPGITTHADHAAQHSDYPANHNHLPSKAQRKEAFRADIRGGYAAPSAGITTIAGEDYDV